MTPSFITANDFWDYWGVNLNGKLKDDDKQATKAETFLARVELRLMAWIDRHTFRTYDFYRLSDYQLKNWKYALLEQAMYMWRNGDIGQDSGYNQETGQISPRATLEEITVCEPALNFLVNAGLYNQKIKNRKRYMTSDTFGTIGLNKRNRPRNVPIEPYVPDPPTDE